MNERRERTRILRALSQERTRDFHQQQIGTERVFLPEGYDVEARAWTGWTENHVASILQAPYSIEKIRMNVRLVEATADKVRVESIEVKI